MPRTELVMRSPPLAGRLVGRDAELDYSLRELRAGATVVVGGAPGVGKTRFLLELGERARSAGWVVHRVTGTRAARTLPFAAVTQLLAGGTGAGASDDLWMVLTTSLGLDQPEDHLVVVDDAHLVDEPSGAVVRRLAGLHRCALVLAVRSGEPLPEPMSTLAGDSRTRRLELQALSEDEMAQVVSLLLDGPVDDASRRRLWEAARGNALFVRELVAHARARGALRERAGVWMLDGPLAVGPSLAELLAQRLEGMASPERVVLEVIALGEPLGVSVLDADPSVLAGLVAEGLAELRDDGRRRSVLVGHPLYGDAVRAAIPARRAARVRVMLAQRIEDQGLRRRGDVMQVANLRVAAGAAVDPAVLVRAAWEAWAHREPATVERFTALALRAGPDAEASYLLGASFADRGCYDEALAVWHLPLVGECSDLLRVRIAHAAAQTVAGTLGAPDRAAGVLDLASERIGAADARVLLAAARAGVLTRAADVERAHALIAEGGPDEARVWTWIGAARRRVAEGDLTSVADEADAIAALAARDPCTPSAVPVVASLRFAALVGAGRLADAERHATASVDRAQSLAGLGFVALVRGAILEATDLLTEAVELRRAHDDGSLRPALYRLALLRAMSGDGAAATALLGEAEESHPGDGWPLVREARVRAAQCAAAGNVAAACEILDEDLEAARAGGPYHELPLLHDLARYGAAGPASTRLREIAPAFGGELAPLYRDHAAAIATRDHRSLLDVAKRCGDAGLHLDAAELTAVAADALRATGSAARAARIAAGVTDLAPGCRFVRSPLFALLDEPTSLASLTAREREVAVLAARGSTDADIASCLSISVRTVNAHLRAVYRKLEVGGRASLRELPGLGG